MPDVTKDVAATYRMKPPDLDRLLQSLQAEDYELIGPTVRNQAIVVAGIEGIADLPVGIRDSHQRGRYRLTPRSDSALFGYVAGPDGWKRHLHAPRQVLFTARSTQDGLRFIPPDPPAIPRRAFVGVRACDLAAILNQDRFLQDGAVQDPSYVAHRRNLFVIAVNCTEPGAHCFCGSMNTGPRARTGYDVLLTELIDGGDHRLVAESGTDEGRDRLEGLGISLASREDVSDSKKRVAEARQRMGRELRTTDLRGLLSASLEHPRWDDVETRCLACGNCTAVCPTCFCTTIEDETDLDGRESQRIQLWDSCFSLAFSYMHGGPSRVSVRSRYRQWLTHKFGSWVDQVGVSGCVGCGRCITWCPAGIDVTEELAAIQGKG
ncbi:MAG: 4Fe-4S dicluster domain-containing protein [Myxococcota bacterium]